MRFRARKLIEKGNLVGIVRPARSRIEPIAPTTLVGSTCVTPVGFALNDATVGALVEVGAVGIVKLPVDMTTWRGVLGRS